MLHILFSPDCCKLKNRLRVNCLSRSKCITTIIFLIVHFLFKKLFKFLPHLFFVFQPPMIQLRILNEFVSTESHSPSAPQRCFVSHAHESNKKENTRK